MRNFLGTYWKTILALVILVLLAIYTMSPSSARPELAARLRTHVQAIAGEPDTANPAALEQAARHIETALAAEGYQVLRSQYSTAGHPVRNIEASLANLAGHVRPEQVFIVGARYDPNGNGSGAAAVLELARLLKAMQPAYGTELKFVFLVSGAGAPPDAGATDGMHRAKVARHRYDPGSAPAGNFIAFAGTPASAATVRETLAAFRAAPDSPAEGLASPAYVQGVTLLDRAPGNRAGYPALMVTDTAFLRYPYYHTAGDDADKPDYEGMARVVTALARTIGALAGGTRT